MPSRAAIDGFLAGKHVAVVGVSRNSKQFANVVYRHMRGAGYALYPVNPAAGEIEGDVAYAQLRDVPDPIDGVLIMVNRAAAKQVVEDCVARGVERVWLHRGLGSAGALSDEAVAVCREEHVEVVAGACPLMFISPSRHIHWLHRQFARRSMTD